MGRSSFEGALLAQFLGELASFSGDIYEVCLHLAWFVRATEQLVVGMLYVHRLFANFIFELSLVDHFFRVSRENRVGALSRACARLAVEILGLDWAKVGYQKECQSFSGNNPSIPKDKIILNNTGDGWRYDEFPFEKQVMY